MKPRFAQRETLVDGNAVGFPAAIGRGAAQHRGAARQILLEDDIDHARNRIRAILRRGAIAQHFDTGNAV